MNRAMERRLARLEARRRRSEDDIGDDLPTLRLEDIFVQIVAAIGVDRTRALIEAAMIRADIPRRDIAERNHVRAWRDAGRLPRVSAGDG